MRIQAFNIIQTRHSVKNSETKNHRTKCCFHSITTESLESKLKRIKMEWKNKRREETKRKDEVSQQI